MVWLKKVWDFFGGSSYLVYLILACLAGFSWYSWNSFIDERAQREIASQAAKDNAKAIEELLKFKAETEKVLADVEIKKEEAEKETIEKEETYKEIIEKDTVSKDWSSEKIPLQIQDLLYN